MKLTDCSLMPFGKYKGTPLGNIPANYLLALKEKGFNRVRKPKMLDAVMEYISDNYEILIQESQEEISDDSFELTDFFDFDYDEKELFAEY